MYALCLGVFAICHAFAISSLSFLRYLKTSTEQNKEPGLAKTITSRFKYYKE